MNEEPLVLFEQDSRGVVHADAEPARGLQRAVRGDARGAAGGARPRGRRRRGARGRDRRRRPGLLRRPRPEGDARRARRWTTTSACSTQCGRMMLTIQQLPVPVIARVHGIATAAGCQLVAMCDLAVAAHDARFAVSGVNLGLFCSTPSVALSRNLSRKAAFEMLVTGEFISADAGAREGPGQPRRRARRAGRRRSSAWWPASSPSRAWPSPPARACSTASSRPASPRPTPTPASTMACNMMDASALEGVQAFIDKRPPAWARGST